MKQNQHLLTISEFSRISEVKRKTLIFYDTIGVFCPKYTAPNGYRYYAHEQIYVISMIQILKELGIPLSKIKDYTADITPGHALSFLKEQQQNLTEKIRSLQSVQGMLEERLVRLEEGTSMDTRNVQLLSFEETLIFQSTPFEADRQAIPDEIWLDFYLHCKQNHVTFGYPEGYLTAREQLKKQETKTVSRIVAFVKDASLANASIPAGLFAAACGPGSLEDTDSIYERLFFSFVKIGWKSSEMPARNVSLTKSEAPKKRTDYESSNSSPLFHMIRNFGIPFSDSFHNKRTIP